MKKTIKLLFILFFFASTITEAQPDTSVRAAPQPDTIISNVQIKKSVQTFIKLIGGDDARQYGLENVEELNSLTPGTQFRRYMIDLEEIKNYQPDGDVKSIIKEYPYVEVSLVSRTGQIRTSIEYVNKNGQWRASRYGSTPELILLKNAQSTLEDIAIRKGKLIRIPSLGISFIAVESGSGLRFISLEGRSDLKLRKGENIAASDAILRLKPLAKEHQNLPN